MSSLKMERNVILIFTGPLSSLVIHSLNLQTSQKKLYKRKCHTSSQLFNIISSTFNVKEIKAFVFCSMDIKSVPFSKAYSFRIACHFFCERNEIFYIFTEEILLNALAGITCSKISVKEGEEVLFVSSGGGAVSALGIVKIIREKEYYRIYETLNITNPEFLQRNFFNNYHPQKVIILHNSVTNVKSINEFFKQFEPIILTQGSKKELLREAAIAKVLHLRGEKINPYDIVTHCIIPYKVYNGKKFLFEFKEFDLVPTEKSVILEANTEKDIMIYPPGGHASLQHIPFPFESKKINVTFTLDISSFYGLHVNVIDDKNDLNEKLPKLKIGDKPEKIQIIFDKQNFSVSLFANGNKEYPMKDSDGLEKTPIYIAFTQKKPLIGKAAKEVYDEKPEFVVYDLIKLCSISSSDVMNPKWKFELSKNPESGAIAVTFQSEKGKTEASADFLLALILRNAIKRVLKETGELVSELEISFNGFSPNEMLKKNFIEAAASIKFRGKLMKVKTAFI